MAGTKIKPSAKSQGKDIRGFFAGGGGGSKSAGSSMSTQRSNGSLKPSGSTKPDVIEIMSDEDHVESGSKHFHPKATPRSTQPKSERVMDEDDTPSPAPTLKRKKTLIVSSDEEDEEAEKASPPKKKAAVAASSSKAASSSTSASKPTPKAKEPAPRRTSTPAKKRKQDDDFIASSSEEEVHDDYQDNEDEDLPKKGKAKSKAAPQKAPSKKAVPAKKGASAKAPAEKATGTKGKAAAKEETVDADEDKPKPKFNWAAAKAAKAAGPMAPGSKPLPTPAAPDCLAGLSFVFTGELTSLSRDEAVELAKRNGGRITGQPSSKTSYVVVGSDAGPSKLAAIKKNNLKTLDEDGFLNLIATRVPDMSSLDDKTKKKLEKDREAIRTAAAEMEKREKKAAKASAASGSTSKTAAENKLWTDRYAPQTLKEVCGNKGQVEKLQRWLHDWSSSLKSGFKKPGKDGMNVFRAVLITGSPGIGKTTSAHLCAKLEGFTPIELNASDARSKKLVENSTNIANTSLDGWMGGGQTTNAAGVTITEKSCLIMDEVDGMSAGDRGGVGALAALIRKAKIPIICIANDRGAPKLKPLATVAYNLTFRKPEVASVRSRILSIAFKEKMKIPANVIDQLIEGAQSDIRQVLNMLSTWRLQADTMDFDEGKALVKMNEKYAIMTPFNIIQKMLGPYMFSSTSRETLNDKMELYFHDHSFVPLFIQENYLKTQPARVKNLDGPEKALKQLELLDKAAASISDGDLVDSLIHGPEQHWSLMPLHAVCSTVRPASFLYGMGVAYGGPNAMSFPQWLGQNSKQNKLTRQLTEVQARMRLHVSGDKAEIRQSYIPAMFPYIVKPLVDEGASAVDEVIERMDDYFISREDWDTIVELGVDQNKDDFVLKKISTATKTSFTRKYNARDHPIPFHKAADMGKAPRQLAAAGPIPDLEEALDVDEVEDAADEVEDASDDDVSKDKLIKAPKKAAAKSATAKGTTKGTAKGTAKGKAKAKK
ncbi:DNA replication factor C large subunit [Rhodofomes roseus]|uniref:Replication factor C subunit 1 n=1 Tax=Rhodofomes roseus TaxID=34475 RepID=A0ABQ8KX37_9APHY|nr:DNA replication factor C large subunit [Rhodofomes roseus]KAH9843593.1 DNA replication factor C large subunit [Rhodofomes roseus]